jgi:hypothetical protein
MEAPLDRRDEKNLPIVTRWLDLATWLMETTARLPRHLRHSLVHRMDGEVLQVLTLLTEAAYTRRKVMLLKEANLALSRLRILLELAERLKALSPGAYAHATVAIDEVGRMLGGWLKEVVSREGA